MLAMVLSSCGSKKDNTSQAQSILNALLNGNYQDAAKDFDDNMKTALPVTDLEAAWKAITEQAGPFVEQTATRKTKQDGFDIIYITCKFEKGVLDMKAVFNNKQKVSGLFFQPAGTQ